MVREVRSREIIGCGEGGGEGERRYGWKREGRTQEIEIFSNVSFYRECLSSPDFMNFQCIRCIALKIYASSLKYSRSSRKRPRELVPDLGNWKKWSELELVAYENAVL